MVPRGRLGNHLSTYALLAAIALHHPTILPHLSTSTTQHLSLHFLPQHLLLPPVSRLCLCRNVSGVPAVPWGWEEWRGGVEGLHTLPQGAWILPPSTSHHTRSSLLLPHTATIVSSLLLRPALVEAGARRLVKAREEWRRRNRKRVAREGVVVEDLVVVGVHHRYHPIHLLPIQSSINHPPLHPATHSCAQAG